MHKQTYISIELILIAITEDNNEVAHISSTEVVARSVKVPKPVSDSSNFKRSAIVVSVTDSRR